MSFRVRITKCSLYDFWYQYCIDLEFDVVKMDKEFFKLTHSNRVIHRGDCVLVYKNKLKKNIGLSAIEVKVAKDGYKNVSQALRSLGAAAFKRKYHNK